VALAIEMGADAFETGKTFYPHPMLAMLGESIGMVGEVDILQKEKNPVQNYEKSNIGNRPPNQMRQ
jgi:hypothetical protein